MNSWTSGLIAAVGALGIEPGDEVLVTPWLCVNKQYPYFTGIPIPVFVDIEEDTFCMI